MPQYDAWVIRVLIDDYFGLLSQIIGQITGVFLFGPPIRHIRNDIDAMLVTQVQKIFLERQPATADRIDVCLLEVTDFLNPMVFPAFACSSRNGLRRDHTSNLDWNPVDPKSHSADLDLAKPNR
jgi:hypothetical protein